MLYLESQICKLNPLTSLPDSTTLPVFHFVKGHLAKQFQNNNNLNKKKIAGMFIFQSQHRKNNGMNSVHNVV